jgi:hypothetical protein
MCDYSLMGVPNRLAVKEEQLVLHKFRTGSLGLASPLELDVDLVNPPTERPRSFWARASLFFNPPEKPSVRAVCIPPGAQLVVEDIPASLQQGLGIGPIELVTFTQITLPNSNSGQFEVSGSHRDAVRFKNGREVRLQDLREGQRMWVMDLGAEAGSEPVREAFSQT